MVYERSPSTTSTSYVNVPSGSVRNGSFCLPFPAWHLGPCNGPLCMAGCVHPKPKFSVELMLRQHFPPFSCQTGLRGCPSGVFSLGSPCVPFCPLSAASGVLLTLDPRGGLGNTAAPLPTSHGPSASLTLLVCDPSSFSGQYSYIYSLASSALH